MSVANRITVGLTPRGAQALEEAVKLTRENQTDVVNAALQAYLLLLRTVDQGGGVYLREHPQAELERLRML